MNFYDHMQHLVFMVLPRVSLTAKGFARSHAIIRVHFQDWTKMASNMSHFINLNCGASSSSTSLPVRFMAFDRPLAASLSTKIEIIFSGRLTLWRKAEKRPRKWCVRRSANVHDVGQLDGVLGHLMVDLIRIQSHAECSSSVIHLVNRGFQFINSLCIFLPFSAYLSSPTQLGPSKASKTKEQVGGKKSHGDSNFPSGSPSNGNNNMWKTRRTVVWERWRERGAT